MSPLSEIANKPAFACSSGVTHMPFQQGLTLRELAAVHAMQGILACGHRIDSAAAINAVAAADLLISELVRTQSSQSSP